MANMPGNTVARAKEAANYQGTCFRETEQPPAPRETTQRTSSQPPTLCLEQQGLGRVAKLLMLYHQISILTYTIRPKRSLNPTPIELGLN